MRCRTSDRTEGGGRGAAALAEELAGRYGVAMRCIGRPVEPRVAGWEADLRESHGCILEAGGQVDDALADGAFPLLLASDCTVCLTTLGAVARHVPDVRILWLDAHGDFNTPNTTRSGFLGGMCLAGACGRWETGFGPALDPSRVVTCGVRDLDGGERVELARAGVGMAEGPAQVAPLLRGLSVYVHLDLDVLDPGVFPAQFPAAGGLSEGALRTLLAEVAAASRVVGLEVTAFEGDADPRALARQARLVADLLAAALPAGYQD